MKTEQITSLAEKLIGNYEIQDNMSSPYYQDWCEVTVDELTAFITEELNSESL